MHPPTAATVFVDWLKGLVEKIQHASGAIDIRAEIKHFHENLAEHDSMRDGALMLQTCVSALKREVAAVTQVTADLRRRLQYSDAPRPAASATRSTRRVRPAIVCTAILTPAIVKMARGLKRNIGAEALTGAEPGPVVFTTQGVEESIAAILSASQGADIYSLLGLSPTDQIIIVDDVETTVAVEYTLAHQADHDSNSLSPSLAGGSYTPPASEMADSEECLSFSPKALSPLSTPLMLPATHKLFDAEATPPTRVPDDSEMIGDSEALSPIINAPAEAFQYNFAAEQMQRRKSQASVRLQRSKRSRQEIKLHYDMTIDASPLEIVALNQTLVLPTAWLPVSPLLPGVTSSSPLAEFAEHISHHLWSPSDVKTPFQSEEEVIEDVVGGSDDDDVTFAADVESDASTDEEVLEEENTSTNIYVRSMKVLSKPVRSKLKHLEKPITYDALVHGTDRRSASRVLFHLLVSSAHKELHTVQKCAFDKILISRSECVHTRSSAHS